jgi:hypothetical protein
MEEEKSWQRSLSIGNVRLMDVAVGTSRWGFKERL